MAPLFDLSLLSLCWLAAGLILAVLASQLCWAWVELTPTNNLAAQLLQRTGAGTSLCIGLWAVHALSASIWPLDIEVGYEPSGEAAMACVAIAACAALLAGWDQRRSRRSIGLKRWGQHAFLLGTVIAAWQMLALRNAGWRPGIEWSQGKVVLAWACSVAGCLGSFALYHGMRPRDLRSFAWHRLLAGSLLGATVVVSQGLVWLGAGLHSQRASSHAEPLGTGVLCGLACLGGAALLALLQIVLRQRVRARSQREQVRRELDKHALNDRLTGLPNRQLFEGTLSQAVRRADTEDLRLALLFINLDGLKEINHSIGRDGGDRVLREVVSRLRALSAPHHVARLAGDEFMALVTEDPDQDLVSEHANRLIRSVGQPYVVEGREVSLSCSIGVAMYPEHGAMSTMIGHAQLAMSQAKAAGGATHAFFEQRMVRGARDDVELSRDLRQALARGQIELYYQPKIHAPSGEITGAEALMRWQHPQRGMVSPAVFIPIAERYGLINGLGQWVINEACRQSRAWRDSGLRMRVAINLSVHQLRQADLVEQIQDALQRHRINPELITCEVTESSAMDDTEVTTRVLGRLKELGVHLSIDDFGTGHSSLSYLRKLPADELKIDRSFVLDLESSEEARKVALAVINLAKALDLQVVAEGVETEGQNRILREYGCDQLQGYLFAKPMSAKSLALWAMDDVGPRTMAFRSSLFTETRPVPVI